MGLFDSIKDAIRPDDDATRAQAPEGKHVDRNAAPEFLDNPVGPEAQTGGKHTRRHEME